MAKFFNQRVKKSGASTGTIVIASIVGVLIVIAIGVLISVKSKNNHKDAVIKIRDSVAVEVNSKLPDKTLFFSELEGVKEKDIKTNYDKVNLEKVGTYEVKIKIYNESYTSKLEVVDTEAPVLKTKDVNVAIGGTYKPEDFVESCKDNSDTDCKIEFYDLSLTQSGEKIDYSAFTAEGSYTVQIVATDDAGNKTSPQSATLNIGKNNVKTPTVCKYGNDSYDTSKYILAVNVTENGCGLDLNVYQDEAKLKLVNSIVENEKAKLKKEFSTIKLNTTDIYLNSDIGPVLNMSGTGLVGYTLKITVSINKGTANEEVIEEYFVNLKGERQYTINKYL